MKTPAKIIISISAFILFSFLTPSAFASEALLSWDANSEPDLGGYRVHYGNSPGNYSNSIDVGNQTAFTVTGLTTGTYYFALTAYDIFENESGFSGEVSKTITIQTDTIPPVISNISISSLGSSSVTINWTTDELAENQVQYGLTETYGMSTIYNSTLSANHSVLIRDLSPSTTYHFRLINSDESGNIAVSNDQIFTTTPELDNTPPNDVQNFSAVPENQSIRLSWTNPADADYKGVRIRFKTDNFPVDINDGTLLGDFLGAPDEEGNTLHFGLDSEKTYFYSASSFDDSGNFQSTVYASVSPLGSVPPTPGSSDQSSSASGGCGMINPNNMGNPPGPGQAADILILLVSCLIGMLKGKNRAILARIAGKHAGKLKQAFIRIASKPGRIIGHCGKSQGMEWAVERNVHSGWNVKWGLIFRAVVMELWLVRYGFWQLITGPTHWQRIFIPAIQTQDSTY